MVPKVEAGLERIAGRRAKSPHCRRRHAPYALAGVLFRSREWGPKSSPSKRTTMRRGLAPAEPVIRESTDWQSLALPDLTIVKESCRESCHHSAVPRLIEQFRPLRDRQLQAVSRLPGARRGLVRLGRRGESLSRLLSRLGLRPARPLSAAGRARRSRSRSAELIHVPNTWYTEAQGAARRAAVHAAASAAGLLLQQRHRGERGGHQAGPAARRRDATRSSRSKQLSWPHARGAHRHGGSRSITRESSRWSPASATPRSAISTRSQD